MRKIRGFKLKHRVTTLFRFFLHRNRSSSGYRRLSFFPPDPNPKPISALFNSLKTKAKSLCSANPGRILGRGYVPMDRNHRLVEVPKGQMAVYVGQKDGGDFRRVLVPVVYFNHPLFGDLLREAEEEFGFDHSGGITIPCRISDFENVKTRIAEGRCGRNLLTWKKGSS
ncbi:auxin-responsive protein SAUR36 [Camellia sinensis]|uniref:Uncharacterized protein n=1 Tax=Camellia sinensis var. sinensis TaxID=542762 RepID=A0A4S4E3L7_CAMSN|nr:auxin-responsive protein SAUR36 [Camellia sinensis]THG09816.1 hypothetical protein TEA_010592 [Camellia sinensis var. sinensis]